MMSADLVLRKNAQNTHTHCNAKEEEEEEKQT
jgi:hypothetical protein